MTSPWDSVSSWELGSDVRSHLCLNPGIGNQSGPWGPEISDLFSRFLGFLQLSQQCRVLAGGLTRGKQGHQFLPQSVAMAISRPRRRGIKLRDPCPQAGQPSSGPGVGTIAGTLEPPPTPRYHTSFFSNCLNIIAGILILLLNINSGNIY